MGKTAQKDPTLPIGQEYLEEMKSQNKQGQETLVTAYTFLMCQEKKKSDHWRWRRGGKIPTVCISFIWIVNICLAVRRTEHLFQLLRFSLIMSTPTFGRVGRCWGAMTLRVARWGLGNWSRLGSINHTCRGSREPRSTTGCVFRDGGGVETPWR